MLQVVISLVLFAVPFASFAADADLEYFANAFEQITSIITDILIPLVLALALLLFIWGVIKFFILGAASEENRAVGRAYMIYAIVGLVAIVAVWGLVDLLLQITGIEVEGPPPAPGVPS